MEGYNTDYYAHELQELWNSCLSCRDRYVELYRIFNEILNDGTAYNKIVFTNSFARFTYIAQQKCISRPLIISINAMRSRCRKMKTLSDSDAGRFFPYDFRSVVQFLCAITSRTNDPHSTYPILLSLLAQTPTGSPTQRRGRIERDCIRIYVTRWDENFIYGHVDEDGIEGQIKVCYNDDCNYLGNWSYIRQLLDESTQLNLVNPHFNDGVYYPELIIYQPDFLIDISSIAACFEQYGASPYNYLINKLKENVTTRPILLGNFASQLLDEEINSRENPIPYKHSVTSFFRRNAMSIVACDDDMTSFHADAMQQKDNIHKIINTALEEDKSVDLTKALLEPSFFCEMLGIQGRMDLLQSDYRVLVEQKSGKKDFKTRGHVEKHYVQILLYMALLHYSFHLRNDDISCFLLYSKYEDGLLKEGPAPQLLFEALKIRNQITWNEFLFARGGMAEVLDRLTPEHLNTLRRFDSFWQKYVCPPIKSLLDTIHNASPLERQYFFRMLQFVEKEQLLSKCGTSEREGSGMASVWNSTIEEKKSAGNIFDELTVMHYDRLLNDAKDEGITEITLHIPSTADDYLPNFRIGDIVILYKYRRGEMPDARRGIVFRTNIEDIKDNLITLRMRAPQKNASIFLQDEDTLWAIEHDYMESSYTGLYRSLYAFLKANADRRSLILGQRKPRVDHSIRLSHDYSMGGSSPMFNDLVLKAMQAQDYFIVIGPPGTGKTSFGMINILKETLFYPYTSALLMSYTNRAVDEICSKLVADGIDFIRIGTELSCPVVYHDYLLENKATKCKDSYSLRHMLERTRVFVGTTTAVNSHQDIFSIKHFALAIIDEASQILEPQLIGLLSARHASLNAIDKFVLIGDHKQLPAVVTQSEKESTVDSPLLREIGLTNCRNSLFERLLRIQDESSPVVFRLNRQGRMHNDVALFPRHFFYEDNLFTVPMAHQHKELHFPNHSHERYEELLSCNRLIFVNVECSDRGISYKVNQPEAEHIAEAVYAVWKLYNNNERPFTPSETVGVIVPYRHQIARVRHEIDKYGIEQLHHITIDTVERYQGSERDVIIYGFTVQRPFQLKFLTDNTFIENGRTIDRKLNVAMTRAREQLLLIGNESLLSQNPLFKELIGYIKKV